MRDTEIEINKNILKIEEYIREFPAEICEVLNFKDFFIVRLIYECDVLDNIFCVNKKNEILWRINEIISKKEEAYTGVEKKTEDIVEVTSFMGINYKISLKERRVLKEKVTK